MLDYVRKCARCGVPLQCDEICVKETVSRRFPNHRRLRVLCAECYELETGRDAPKHVKRIS